jgi:hypothetical protein
VKLWALEITHGAVAYINIECNERIGNGLSSELFIG